MLVSSIFIVSQSLGKISTLDELTVLWGVKGKINHLTLLSLRVKPGEGAPCWRLARGPKARGSSRQELGLWDPGTFPHFKALLPSWLAWRNWAFLLRTPRFPFNIFANFHKNAANRYFYPHFTEDILWRGEPSPLPIHRCGAGLWYKLMAHVNSKYNSW